MFRFGLPPPVRRPSSRPGVDASAPRPRSTPRRGRWRVGRGRGRSRVEDAAAAGRRCGGRMAAVLVRRRRPGPARGLGPAPPEKTKSGRQRPR
eukprot:scaffold4477_cov417-Prasinococcus_capsulatus_cf.AAC.1